jgi:hypothetical protein
LGDIDVELRFAGGWGVVLDDGTKEVVATDDLAVLPNPVRIPENARRRSLNRPTSPDAVDEELLEEEEFSAAVLSTPDCASPSSRAEESFESLRECDNVSCASVADELKW